MEGRASVQLISCTEHRNAGGQDVCPVVPRNRAPRPQHCHHLEANVPTHKDIGRRGKRASCADKSPRGRLQGSRISSGRAQLVGTALTATREALDESIAGLDLEARCQRDGEGDHETDRIGVCKKSGVVFDLFFY